MSRIFAVTLSVLAALSLTFAQNKEKRPGSSSDAEAQVEKLDREAFDAFLRQDAGWYEKNEAADEYVGINPDGTVINKHQDLAAVKSGDLKIESGTRDDARVRVYGDTAVVTGKATVKGAYKGQDISGQYRFTTVYAKKSGKWQAVASQATRIAQ